MDKLGAISLFAKAVETGSFSEAGRQSGLAPSSVSRRIVELEGWVGAALFHRTTRKLNLTEVGRSFYEHTRGILLDLEEAKVTAAQLEAGFRGRHRSRHGEDTHRPGVFYRRHCRCAPDDGGRPGGR